MKLERLHIQGFKSFKDRTTIHFDDGITGIVGPNGCGKSNIVDALFWVMGEQSAKHLRGQKMSDLIFSGSKKYSPGSFAEVTLVLSNLEGKHIHIGNKVVAPQEIQLTRKLYRNGDTEYRINNLPARLKDIQEVFMDTGAGAKSYSIIAQGEIDRLVKAKPHERRVMIEEVAGITKFKMRKKESLRKIEQTQNNIERISDLKKEVYKNLKSLEGQAEKAEKARSLREKVKKNALVVNTHRELEFLTKIQDLNKNNEDNSQKIEAYKLEKESIDASLENEKNQKIELIDHIDALQEEFNLKSRELVSLEERLNASKNSVEEKKAYIDEKKRELDSLDADLKSREQKIEEVTSELEALEKPSTDETPDYSLIEENIATLQAEIQELETQHLDNIKKREEATQKIAEADAKIYKNEHQLEEQARALQEIAQEIEELEKYFNQLTDETEIKKEKLSQSEDKFNRLEIQKEEIKEELSTLETQKNELNKKLSEKEKGQVEISTRINSLEELTASTLERTGNHSFVKECSGNLLQDLFTVEENYERTVEALLRPYLEAVVGYETEEDIVEWLKQNDENFSCIQPSSKKTDFSVGKSLLEVLSFANEVPAAIKNFLGSFFLVDSIDLENLNEFFGNHFLAVATNDGSKVLRNFQGNLQFESNSESEQADSVLERNNQIESLKVDLEVVEDEISELKREVSKIADKIVTKEDLKVEIEQERESLKEDVISLKSFLSERNTVVVNEDRLEKLEKRKREISLLRMDLCEKEEELEEEKQVLDENLLVVKEEIIQFEEFFNEKKQAYEEAREELVEAKSEQKSFEFKKVQFEKQLKDFEEQKAAIEEKITTTLEVIEQSEEYIRNFGDNQVEATGNIEELTNLLKEKEQELSESKDELEQLTQAMETRETKARDLDNKINKVEKDNLEKVLKLEKAIDDEELLVRNTFEEYRVDIRAIILGFMELEEIEGLKDLEKMFFIESESGIRRVESEAYEFQKRFPGQVAEAKEKLKNYKSSLNRLGHINWQAVEDYDKQKVRYDFLKDQEEELNLSIKDLMVAIERIDGKSKTRFQEAYTEVNEKFEKVFPIIFGGGNARLHLTGNMDEEDFGIEIIASPPGKKMQNINLMSGGEKALTAVALIFSIFLVKPSPFCLLDEVDAPLDDANVGRFNQLLREMSSESQFILITHNKKTMELNDKLYGITMQEPGVSKTVSVQLQ